MSASETTGAAPEDAPRTLFRSPELADFLEAAFNNEDLDYDDLSQASFTFTPLT